MGMKSITAYAVEVRVNGLWVPAHRIPDEFPTEGDAIKAAKQHYPITCRIQATKGGPVGIRVVDVVLV